MKAWHFTGDRLRDGRPLPAVGEVLLHDGPLVICTSGLHASARLIDALEYAPGSMLHRVECGGEMLREADKLCCRERTRLWSLDATAVLWKFARLCALDVVHLWAAPEIVVRWLRTGDSALRDPAWASARASARASAQASARDPAWASARIAQDRRLTRMARAARKALEEKK